MKSVYFIHPGVKNIESFINYFCLEKMNLEDKIIWDSSTPDLLFVSEHIYLNMRYFNEFKKFLKRSQTVKIFVAGECIAPDLNLFDYAFVFDKYLKDEDRIIRFPTLLFFRDSIYKNRNTMTCDSVKKELVGKDRFCCFIYSNGNAHPMRDQLFYSISKYRKVDSLGKHLHNVDVKESRTSNDWRKQSIELKSKYKFAISSENASYEGYTSEKLLSSFQAHTVPIYWGNPDIENEFNEKAFINCNKFKNLNDLVEYIKFIDENDEKWCEIVAQPWMTVEQEKKAKVEIEAYYQSISKLINNSTSELLRIPEGTYPNRYREFFSENKLYLRLNYSRLGKAYKKLTKFIRNNHSI